MRIKEDVAQSLQKALKDSGKSVVRLDFIGFGCGSVEVDIVMDEPKEYDTTFEVQGVQFVIDKEFNYILEQIQIIKTSRGFEVTLVGYDSNK